MPAARTWLVAAVVAVAAFLLYDATLLPGQDLGDTASFQATVGSDYITPRQAYPLYYSTAALFVRGFRGEPAFALNLASAVFGALACGLLTVAVAGLTGRKVAGALAGLLYAASYTFWSQCIIAEVYALHAFCVGICLLALLAWAARPSAARLTLFFALYALGFGNHLSMILLLPGFALFLLLASPGGPRSMLRPRVAAAAVAMAALGACQYLWNLSYLLHEPNRAPGWRELFSAFWFDVTKADWRATLVGTVPERALHDRVLMYWFDLRQQFGVAGVALAAVGIAWLLLPRSMPGHLSRISRRRVCATLVLLYLVNWVFAFTYNVGDAHVFYLPSHLIVAIAAGIGASAILDIAGTRRHIAALAAVAVVAYPAWRAYDTFPALDRSHDVSVRRFFDGLTAGLDPNNAVLGADLNWQLHNGLDYYSKFTRPDLALVDSDNCLLYVPFLVASNRDINRPLVATNGAASEITAAYGPLFDVERDGRAPARSFASRISRFPPGTVYALTLLSPYPDIPFDAGDLRQAVADMTGGAVRLQLPLEKRYAVIAGRIGEKPSLMKWESGPFRKRWRVGNVDLDVRIECWLPEDTIRRMGFGRVIVHRRPVMTVDRGAGFVALDDNGSVEGVEYGSGLLSPQPRWVIRQRRPGAGG